MPKIAEAAFIAGWRLGREAMEHEQARGGICEAGVTTTGNPDDSKPCDNQARFAVLLPANRDRAAQRIKLCAPCWETLQRVLDGIRKERR